ncbi:early activation antigen CD69 [Eucyclogobius newberryi]|uniref:early activation antigen CD69 n=1 Tax=Eucyclogobius newberryi TaxID=166745 RepID=UPI003B5A74A9
MEMEEIGNEPVYSSGEGTSGTEVKTEGKPETEIYSKLGNTSEDLYAEFPPTKEKKALGVRQWQRACVFLAATCLILVATVVILAIKLSNGPSACVKSAFDGPPAFHIGCQSALQSPLCSEGWLQSGRACFLLSRKRKTWAASKKFCEEQGGSLAVITDAAVQNFLTQKGTLSYWIGLNKENTGVWTWVDGQRLTGNSFWSDSDRGVGDCAMLDAAAGDNKSWSKGLCSRPKYYICQKTMIDN